MSAEQLSALTDLFVLFNRQELARLCFVRWLWANTSEQDR